MVLPAKIFEIKAKIDYGLIVSKLKDFREEELYETADGKTIDLVGRVLDLQMKGDSASGIFSKDFIQKTFYKRKLVETPITEETPFWIKSSGGRMFAIVSGPSGSSGGKKLLTNYVANKLSQLFFMTRQEVVEVRIPHETLKGLHERNPQATKLIWFDQVDIPGIEKLCLAGSDIADTQLYRDYLEHGQIWYVVFGVEKRGIVVGITRNAVVTLFSKSTSEEFVTFLVEDLLPLME